MLRESFDPAELSVTSNTDAKTDMALIDLVDDANSHNSAENYIYMLNNQSFDNSQETSNINSDEIYSDEGETVAKIQEDVSALETLYLENQQNAFEDFIRPNFSITRLPTNAYCREWLLKHEQCCLTDSVLEHSDNKRYFKKSNENDIQRVSESAGQRIFDNSQESNQIGNDKVGKL
ncbi:hypothetical protein AVEN_101465-1 [Araneus ventricosus]|uniref:Uncharacterized protein n=1 Tax=Araneus ventricosus TaxID=182803 RepID=A0A4Y2HGD2_ARAVE|nr:hypothetical protein AVEN_101465-1 [Araneus ventricosus]